MLTDEEKKEIRELMRHYATARAAGPESLKIVQNHRGWVSGESLKAVAEMLEMSFEELDSVATFYNMIFRKPVGRHVILICDSISCYIARYDMLLDHLNRTHGIRMGETTPDGRFTLLPAACLGACDHAPAVMIDETLYGDLTPEKIDSILGKYQ